MTVLRSGSGRDHVQIVAGHRAGVIRAFAIGSDGNPVTPGSSGGDLCSIGVGAPRVVACDGTGTGNDMRKPRVTMTWRNFGRAGADVSRITLAAPPGVERDAIIQNGWFYVTASLTVDNPRPGDLRGPSPFEGHRPVLRAWDREGNPIPITSGFDG